MMQRKLHTRLICAVMCAVMIFGLCACGEPEMSQSQIVTMDTSVSFIAYGKNSAAAVKAGESVFKSLDAALDPELPTSTVYAVNHANGASTVISGQMAKMIDTAKKVYKQSGGALDITIYPLVELWGFVDSKFYVPNGEELLDKLGNLCFDKLVLDSFPVSGTYTLTLPSFGKITLAALARGSASNYAIEAMANAGVSSAIVSMPGNIQTLGLKPDGSLWNVAIADPKDPTQFLGTLEVGESALSTTGAYTREFVDLNTKNTYNHIIRPNSGHTVSGSLLSATVVCKDGTLADCLSTAVYVLGYSGALNYWRSYGKKTGEEFELILVTDDNRVVCTSGLIERFTVTNNDYTLKYTE